MIEERKIAFDNISRVLAITRYDIEQHQLINDQSLNIHGETWFRDIFNYVYGLELINANFETTNAPAIDLVDNNEKKAYQITTTRTKEKIENTLLKVKQTKYKNYKLKIFYLLEKAKPNKDTKEYFKTKFNIDNIEKYLFDYTDLIKDIESLETDKLIQLNKKFFLVPFEKYTDEMILNLVIKNILKEQKDIKIDYDEEFGTVDINYKLDINKINERITVAIKKGADYRSILENLTSDNTIEDLRKFIIDKLYKSILLTTLEKKISKKDLINKKTNELQNLASQYKIDFNKLINKLYEKIKSNIEINDFNSMSIAWIIISYFFELCDIGVK